MPNVMAALPNIGSPLFSTPQFGWRPLLQCRAVTVRRRETRWNLQGCLKLAEFFWPAACGLAKSTPRRLSPKIFFGPVILNTSGDAGDAGDVGETRLMLWRRPNHLRSLLLLERRLLLIAEAASRETCLSDWLYNCIEDTIFVVSWFALLTSFNVLPYHTYRVVLYMHNRIVHFLPERKKSKIACLTARCRPPPKHSASLARVACVTWCL